MEKLQGGTFHSWDKAELSFLEKANSLGAQAALRRNGNTKGRFYWLDIVTKEGSFLVFEVEGVEKFCCWPFYSNKTLRATIDPDHLG